MTSLTFEQWLAQVDRHVSGVLDGFTHRDLADAPYRDEYDSGTSPADMLHTIAEYDEIMAMALGMGA